MVNPQKQMYADGFLIDSADMLQIYIGGTAAVEDLPSIWKMEVV